jgi:hypothetical protein
VAAMRIAPPDLSTYFDPLGDRIAVCHRRLK